MRLLRALERLDLAVAAVDPRRRLLAITAAAERLAGEDGILIIRGGRVRLRDPAEDRVLGRALSPPGGAPAGGRIALRAAGGAVRALLDVTPALDDPEADGPASLLRFRTVRLDPEALCELRRAFGLSASEAAVSAELVAGRAPELIAQIRGVALSTVRSQIQSIFRKVGSGSIGELTAALAVFAQGG